MKDALTLSVPSDWTELELDPKKKRAGRVKKQAKAKQPAGRKRAAKKKKKRAGRVKKQARAKQLAGRKRAAKRRAKKPAGSRRSP